MTVYGPDSTRLIPRIKPEWLTEQAECYPPVGVPENRSSIPGSGDKKDCGLRLILALLTIAIFANAAAFAWLAWKVR